MKKIILAKIFAILMLAFALLDNPYGYYQILKWIICGFTAYLAYLAYKNDETAWTWIFGIIAILFNPIAPIYLNREIWSVIDVAVVIIIFISLFQKKLNSFR